MEVETEGQEDNAQQTVGTEHWESRNLRMFPLGKKYVLSSFGFLRLFTIIICLVAFIVSETTYCTMKKTCYISTYHYFSAISFLIFSTSIILYILYITGIVQSLRFHPRVKAIVEITYFGVCIFFYIFASAFLIPRTNGIAGYQISSALSVFVLILITVHLALLLYHTNRQSAITYEKEDESSFDEETADSWVAAASTEHNRESLPRLHSIRLRCSSVESVDRTIPMEEVDLTDSPVFADKSSSHSFSSFSSSSSSCATVEGSWKVMEA